MNESLTGTIAERLEKKSTEELLRIWTENNHRRWSQAAFDIIEGILMARSVKIPEQNPPLGPFGIRQNMRSAIAQMAIILLVIDGLAVSAYFYHHLRYFPAFLFVSIPASAFFYFLNLRITAVILIILTTIVSLFVYSPPMQNALDWLIWNLVFLSPFK